VGIGGAGAKEQNPNLIRSLHAFELGWCLSLGAGLRADLLLRPHIQSDCPDLSYMMLSALNLLQLVEFDV